MPGHCEGGGLSSDLMYLLTRLNVPLYKREGRGGERGEEKRGRGRVERGRGRERGGGEGREGKGRGGRGRGEELFYHSEKG